MSTVPGHAGRLILVEPEGIPLLIFQGRSHLYEGLGAQQVTAQVRLMHELGVRTLLLTNAAGCLNTDFTPGEHMLISDHLNLTGTSPLMGGPRFHDMSQMYSPRLDDVCKRPLSAHGFLYTPASTRGSLAPGMRRRRRSACSATLGADAVGMSTVLEAIQARALDIEVAELSSLTTWAAGITTEPVRHEEVLAMGRALIPQLVSLIRALACPH